jgi:hypothetical protein
MSSVCGHDRLSMDSTMSADGKSFLSAVFVSDIKRLCDLSIGTASLVK